LFSSATSAESVVGVDMTVNSFSVAASVRDGAECRLLPAPAHSML